MMVKILDLILKPEIYIVIALILIFASFYIPIEHVFFKTVALLILHCLTKIEEKL